MLRVEGTERGPAFGDPRTLVEVRGSFAEGSEVDFDELRAEGGHAGERVVEKFFGFGVAEEFEVAWRGHANARRGEVFAR